MNAPIKNVLVASSLTLLLVACKSTQEKMMEDAIEADTGGNADVEMNDNGTVHIEDEDGTYDTSATVPEDWPTDVAVYEDAKVQYSASVNPKTGKPGSVVVLSTTDSVKVVTDLYKKKLAADGWKLESTMQGGEMTILGGTKDNRQVSVMISGADGETNITIAVGEQE